MGKIKKQANHDQDLEQNKWNMRTNYPAIKKHIVRACMDVWKEREQQKYMWTPWNLIEEK